jgi:solute carrier family 25 thiamine pyrophosphate transporter 19
MFDRSIKATTTIAATTLTPLGLSVAGAFAGLTARCLVAPLDVLKIRFQVQAGLDVIRYRGLAQATAFIVREEGILALWRGNGVALVLYGAYMALQFPVYSAIRAEAEHLGASVRDASIGAGAAAGAVATAVTYPLDWARTRRAATSLRGGALPLAFPQHWRTPFAGLSAALIGVIPAGAATFGLYEAARNVWDTSVAASALPTIFRFVGFDDNTASAMLENIRAPFCGGIAGVGSKALTYPLDTAKKRLQMGGITGLETPLLRSPLAALRGIAAVEGIKGWYRGAWPALVKSALTTALIFGSFDIFSTIIIASHSPSMVSG